MGSRPDIKSTTDTFRFLIEQLPENKRLLFDQCTNGPQVLIGIKELRLIEKHDGNSKGVRRFVNAVEPLCSALDVLCQIDPIHLATVWGGLRVVIQVSILLQNLLKSYADEPSSQVITNASLRNSWKA